MFHQLLKLHNFFHRILFYWFFSSTFISLANENTWLQCIPEIVYIHIFFLLITLSNGVHFRDSGEFGIGETNSWKWPYSTICIMKHRSVVVYFSLFLVLCMFSTSLQIAYVHTWDSFIRIKSTWAVEFEAFFIVHTKTTWKQKINGECERHNNGQQHQQIF